MTDQALKSRKNQTDGLGRITSVWEDPAGLNYLTSYGYDPLGNLTSVLQAGSHPRTFTYNSLSQLLTATNPESGTLTYTYDNSGNLLTKVAPAPNQTGSATVTTTYSYDVLNRITGKTYSDGVTAPVVYAYDQSAPWGSPLTNYIGRLTTEYTSNASGTLTDNLYDYDAMGRVIRRAQCQPLNCAAPSQNAFYTYNLLGSPTSLRAVQTGVLDFTISSSYDAAGRLATVSSSYVDAQHPGTLFTVDASAGYYPGGELKKALYSNGLTQSNVYDKRRQPCRFNLNSSNSTLASCSDPVPPTGNVQDFSYGYNLGTFDSGHIATFIGVGNQAFNRTYFYDALDRISTLNQSSGNAGLCSSVYGLSWNYDGAWGNRKDQNVTSGTCNAFHALVDSNNRLSGAPYQYDAAGNMTHDASHSYTYDAENRITAADGGSTTYLYDAEGNRVMKTVSGAWRDYVYGISGNVVAETIATGLNVGYVYAAGQFIAQYRDSTTYFVHQDHLGSTRLLTKLDKSIFDSMDYLPFGEQIAGASGSTHKFTGKERDSESGLDNFGARYDSSSLGRFMSPDPLYLEFHRLIDPQQLNLYSYVRNNPLSLTDPAGLDITCTGDRCEDYLAALQKDVSFKVKYDDNGKVVAAVDKDQKLSKSDKAFLKAIDDTKNHVTINAVGGEKDSSVFFGASHGSTHTINFDQAALLDSSKNAGGMTSAGLVGHETLEGYDEAKGYTMAEGHDWAASLGFPGFDKATAGSAQAQGGMVIGLTGTFHIQGTSINEQITTRFVTPIPQVTFMKNAASEYPTPSPGYPVSVEKKQ